MSAEVRHGYALADLHGLARHAALQARGFHVGGFAEHYEIAWMAIVEELCSREDVPTYPQLLQAGWSAIYAEVTAMRRHYGFADYKNVGTTHGAGSGPRFNMYWLETSMSTPSCETRVVESMAVAQILPRLNPLHLQALVALAATGTFQDGAAALGISYTAFKFRIIEGRRRFRQLWHEGEAPSRPWGVDRRCGLHAGQRREGGGRNVVQRMRTRVRTGAR